MCKFVTSSEYTIEKTKTPNIFFKIEGKPNRDNTWNGFPVEKLGGVKLKTDENILNTSTKLQNIFTNASDKPLKIIIDVDKEMYQKF